MIRTVIIHLLTISSQSNSFNIDVDPSNVLILRPGRASLNRVSLGAGVAPIARGVRPIRPERGSSSGFGFSISQFEDREKGEGFILAGAPWKQNGHGAVYKCGIGAGGACRMEPHLNRDPSSAEDKRQEFSGQQHLGFSVFASSTSGIVGACAPHYAWQTKIYNRTTGAFSTRVRQEPIGRCLVLGPRATQAIAITPNKSPAAATDDGEYDYARVFARGSAVTGLSVVLSEEGHLYMGSPGTFRFRGQLDNQSITDFSQKSVIPSSRPRDLDERFQSKIYSNAYGYLGYSVTTSSNEDLIAIGQPRAKELKTEEQRELGQVVVVRSGNIIQILQGNQFAAYFGAALLMVDVNGDGLEDLLVSSPMRRLTRKKSGKVVETGCVAIFLQTISGAPTGSGARRDAGGAVDLFQTEPASVIHGESDGARFGAALAAVHDLNEDGVADFVVGAPHESTSGAIYVFHGSRNKRLKRFSQKIRPEDLSLGRVFGFGHSLAAGRDMDSNGFPDVTVGTLKSDSVVQLWTRPVAFVEATLAVAPSVIDVLTRPSGLFRSSTPAAEVRLCLKYYGRSLSPSGVFNVTVELDALLDFAKRRIFSSSYQNTFFVIQKLKIEEESCVTEKLILLDEKLEDKLSPILVTATWTIAHLSSDSASSTPGAKTQAPGHPGAILSDASRNRVEATANIAKDCGPDAVCVPDLAVTANIKNATHAFESGEEIVVDVRVWNKKEDAFNSKLLLFLPDGIRYINFRAVRGVATCSPACDDATTDDETTDDVTADDVTADDVTADDVTTDHVACQRKIECDVGNPLRKDHVIQLEFRMDGSEISNTSSKENLNVTATSVNEELKSTLGDNHAPVTIRIVPMASVYMRGVSNPDQLHYGSAPNASCGTNETSLSVNHTYHFQNLGPSKISRARLTIFWPGYVQRLKDGSDVYHDLLVLEDVPKVEGVKGSCRIVRQDITKGQKTKRTRLRDNRSGHHTFRCTFAQTTESDSKEIRIVCVKIRCSLRELNVRGKITISSTLALNTVNTFWPKLHNLTLVSRANLVVTSMPYDVKPKKQIEEFSSIETLGIPCEFNQQIQGDVPWWVYVIASLLGLLVLALLVLLLRCLGFFRRRRKSEESREEEEEAERMMVKANTTKAKEIG